MHLYCVFKMNDPICRAGVRSEQSLVIDRCYHVMTKTYPNLLRIGTKRCNRRSHLYIVDSNFRELFRSIYVCNFFFHLFKMGEVASDFSGRNSQEYSDRQYA